MNFYQIYGCKIDNHRNASIWLRYDGFRSSYEFHFVWNSPLAEGKARIISLSLENTITWLLYKQRRTTYSLIDRKLRFVGYVDLAKIPTAKPDFFPKNVTRFFSSYILWRESRVKFPGLPSAWRKSFYGVSERGSLPKKKILFDRKG